jgi:hypothetical protein
MKFRNDSRDDTVVERERPISARGGFSLGAILTGVVVAFGAMFLLSALVGGLLAAIGVDASEIEAGTQDEGIIASIAIVLALFLAYLWGGYAAGRMSRGAGFVNGLLVPVLALIVAAVVAAAVNAMGAAANLNLPFDESQLPIEGDNLADFGQVVGIASLIAMFVGGILGGTLGQRWHTKLERRVMDEKEAEAEERRRAALDRERERTAAEERRTAPVGAAASTEPIRPSDGDTTERRPAETPGRTVAGERRPASEAPATAAEERRPAPAPPPPDDRRT